MTCAAPSSMVVAGAERSVACPGQPRLDCAPTRRAVLDFTLWLQYAPEVTLLTMIPEHASPEDESAAHKRLERMASDKAKSRAGTELVKTDDAIGAIVERTAEHDVLILGLHRASGGKRVFGEFVLTVAQRSQCAVIMLSQA